MLNQKILLIDGNSLLYRAYYASKYSKISVSNDSNLNGVYLFIRMFFSFIKKNQYFDIVVAFDKSKKTFRNDIYKDYKQNRKQTPPDLISQFEVVYEFLNTCNIKNLSLINYEADDIIGTLSHKYSNDYFIEILTSDTDLLQLVTKHTKVYLTKKGVNDIHEYNFNNINSKLEYDCKNILNIKSLSGDASDNIPSIKGISKRIAIFLFSQYKNIDDLYANIEELNSKVVAYEKTNNLKLRINSEKIKTTLLANKEQLYINLKLVEIQKQLPINMVFEQFNIDPKNLKKFYKKYSFNHLLSKISSDVPEFKISISEITIVKKWSDSLLSKKNYIFLELKDNNYHKKDIGLAFSIYNQKGLFYYEFFSAIKDLNFIKFLESNKYEKYVYDAKLLINHTHLYNIKINNIKYDMMLAAYLINPSKYNEFNYYIETFLNYKLLDLNSFYEKGKIKHLIINNSEFQTYVSIKAIMIAKSYKYIIETLKSKNVDYLYNNIEFPLLFSLAKMEQEGISVDLKMLDYQTKNVEIKIKDYETKIYKLSKYQFNINSPKQIGELIYDKMNLISNPVNKKRKTSIDVLKKLVKKHEIIKLIIEYRKIRKLYSTYLIGFKKYLFEDNKIHTLYNQNKTVTGRLSSSEPNMQNIAANSIEQKELSKIFIPNNSDHYFISFDYSQIELRILAQFSQDPILLKSFKDNIDIHSITAKKIFNLEREETSDERRIAKTVIFGVVYGITAFGLSEQLLISPSKAQKIIDAFYEQYTNIKKYFDKLIAFCKKNGYVTTIYNRFRQIDNINSTNKNAYNIAVRAAMNMPLQGTSADIIKVAILNINKKLIEKKLMSKLILQIHDELIFEVPKNEIDIINDIIPKLMTDISKISNWDVKLKVNSSIGKNLYDLK